MPRPCCQSTRRGFITGCSAAIASLAGSRFNSLAFGAPQGSNDEILVVVFLRGGQDGLHLIAPSDGPDRAHYQALRPSLGIPAATLAAHPLGSLPGPEGPVALGLHPAAALWPIARATLPTSGRPSGRSLTSSPPVRRTTDLRPGSSDKRPTSVSRPSTLKLD